MAGFRDRRRARACRRGLRRASSRSSRRRCASAGCVVAERVGQSAFRIDLAVRRPGDDEHRVAVLVDHAERVAAQPLAERLLGHPGVLRATGWRVVHVLGQGLAGRRRTRSSSGSQRAVRCRRRRRRRDRAPGARGAGARGRRRRLPAPDAARAADAGRGRLRPRRWRAVAARGDVHVGAAAGRGASRRTSRSSGCRSASPVLSVCSIRGRPAVARGPGAAGGARRPGRPPVGLGARWTSSCWPNPDSGSTKAQRAAALGIRRIAEPAFWRMLGVDID